MRAHLPLVIAASLCLLTACSDTPSKQQLQPKPEAGKRSLSEFVDDEKLESTLYKNINNSDLDFSETHVRVSCFKGIVLLTGEIPDEELKQEASRIAQASSGVRQVHNELQLKSNSTFFARSNDNGLEAKIRVKLLASRDIEGSKVRIVVEDRVVYLMGLLTRQETQIATDIAANTSGIERVVRAIDYIN